MNFDRQDRGPVPGKFAEGLRQKFFGQEINFCKVIVLLSSAQFATQMQLYKKKIVICLHPKTDANILNKYIKDISIKKHQSSQFITKAAFVLFHDSSIILDAIFLNLVVPKYP